MARGQSSAGRERAWLSAGRFLKVPRYASPSIVGYIAETLTQIRSCRGSVPRSMRGNRRLGAVCAAERWSHNLLVCERVRRNFTLRRFRAGTEQHQAHHLYAAGKPVGG